MIYNGITLLIGILTVAATFIITNIYHKRQLKKDIAAANNQKTINFFLKGESKR